MPSGGTSAGGREADQSARYEPVSELARGGMAALWLARVRGPSGFTKYVVLKRILPKWADEVEFVEMFLDEARLAATLDHPNAVHVYDAGRDDEGPFFAMEYIHGENLSRLRRALRERGEALPLRHLLTIGIGIAAGLHHAHERRDYDGRPLGIIHRDVSPSNVLVTYEGGVKVVDFGIAKASISEHATRPSVRKGKISFMSPEQCRGDRLDRRSDVFSLGVVLYELCTGARLFRGENEFSVMNRIVNHDVGPPSELRPDLPARLDEILLKALARDPERRYATARALQRDLEALAEAEGLSPSATALGDYVQELFGERAYPWAGLSTGEVESLTPTEMSSRSDADDEPTEALDRSLAAVPEPARGPRRAWWPWVAAPAFVGVVTAGLMVVSGSEGDAPPGAAAGSVPQSEAARAPEAGAEAGASESLDAAVRASASSGSAGVQRSLGSTDAGVVELESGEDSGTGATEAEPDDAGSTGAEEVEPRPRRSRRAGKRRPRPAPEQPVESKPKTPFDPDGPAPRRDAP